MSDVFSFDDLKPAHITANIETHYGRKLSIPLVLPTYEEWEGEEGKFVIPKVPQTKLAPDGVTMLPNPDDPAYIDARNLRGRRVAAYHVVRAMERAGLEVPGEGVRGKSDEMCKIESGVLNSLVKLIYDSSVKAEKAKLNDLAETFPASAVFAGTNGSGDTNGTALEHAFEG